MDDRAAVLGHDELPGPFNMCWHWKEARTLCTLKPGHDGDHVYSVFTITPDTTEPTEEK